MEAERENIELVVARLQHLPSDTNISIGPLGTFTKAELIEHVRSFDEIGRKMIDLEIGFLRSMKEGFFYEQ